MSHRAFSTAAVLPYLAHTSSCHCQAGPCLRSHRKARRINRIGHDSRAGRLITRFYLTTTANDRSVGCMACAPHCSLLKAWWWLWRGGALSVSSSCWVREACIRVVDIVALHVQSLQKAFQAGGRRLAQ